MAYRTDCDTLHAVPRLFHFSDNPSIEAFHPRAPLRHPDSEPLVYAIDEAHSPLYLFPRDCPRIGRWSDPADMQLWIDSAWETRWRTGTIIRYEFEGEGFEDCHDHGVWASRETQIPCSWQIIANLPAQNPRTVSIVPSLTALAREFYDFEGKSFRVADHVSMIRMAALPDWPGSSGQPVRPPG